MAATATEHQPQPAAGEMMTERKIAELYRRLDDTFLSEQSVSPPGKIYVGVSAACDIECPFCPRQHLERTEHNQGLFPADQLDKIVPYAASADYVGLFGEGEPFLHPRFFELARKIKEAGGCAETSTHGMGLTPAVIEQLLELNFDRLAVSMDAPKRRLFNYLRQGADFDTVCANVRRLVAAKRERGVSVPLLSITCTILRRNVKYLVKMVRLAHQLGAEQMVFANLIIVDPANAHLSVLGHPYFIKQLARAQALARRLGMKCDFFKQDPYPWLKPEHDRLGGSFGCTELMHTFQVSRSGNTLPCCWLGGSFGNAFEDSLDVLRNSPERVKWRRGMMRGELNSTCASCDYLQPNSPERAAVLLDELAAELDDVRLPEEHGRRLKELVEEYRQKAKLLFAK